MIDIKIKTATLLGEIQMLAYMVNTFTEHLAFCDYSGHVNGFDVRITKTKDHNDIEYRYRMDTYVPPKDWGNERQMVNRLSAMKSELQKILIENGVNAP
ncbi:hypothetical protein [Paenibacillus naphthalenovorans]|uniref:hypothetical protein n=1 Tax=Paenibacillus naphthalenovorans TaxID=162209 RepID=UPI0008816630|nr:hypothetical protein [Paenibacillus naphthalenovorans]SDJ61945.1 hypothetical protein SAMN05421868_13461 [Paenibacillus naphthalenovorans]